MCPKSFSAVTAYIISDHRERYFVYGRIEEEEFSLEIAKIDCNLP